MTDAADLSKMIPGFEFLQDMARNSAATLPGLGQWVAPTLDPDEIGRRIDELRTVQFWLEQNAKLLATTIQALEVQRMTLATLKGMNLPMADLSESLKIRPWSTEPAAAPAAPVASPSPEPAAPADEPPAAPRRKAAAKPGAAKAAAAPTMVDPMQWWGALTQQFQQIAQAAVADAQTRKGADAAVQPGGPGPAAKPARKGRAPKNRKAP